MVKDSDSSDVYEEIRENLMKMVPKIKFDEMDLKNLVFKEVVQILEPIEWEGSYKGNAHHLSQKIAEKVTNAIMEKMDISKN